MKRLLAIPITALVIILVLVPGCSTNSTTTTAASPNTMTATLPPSPSGLGTFEVSGTIERTIEVDNAPPVQKGSLIIYNRSITWQVHGDLEGVWLHTGTTTRQNVTGHITQDYDSTFTGTVKGKQGTFTAEEKGSGEVSTLTATLTATIVNGAGELANLSGTITVNTTDDGNRTTGTYTGTLNLSK